MYILISKEKKKEKYTKNIVIILNFQFVYILLTF